MNDYKSKYLSLADAVRCVIESNDYMDIEHKSAVSYKMSTCVHGNAVYEGCENCICEFLERALEGVTNECS